MCCSCSSNKYVSLNHITEELEKQSCDPDLWLVGIKCQTDRYRCLSILGIKTLIYSIWPSQSSVVDGRGMKKLHNLSSTKYRPWKLMYNTDIKIFWPLCTGGTNYISRKLYLPGSVVRPPQAGYWRQQTVVENISWIITKNSPKS